MNRQKRAAFVIVGALALAVAGFAGCGKKTTDREEMPPQTVTAAVAARHDVAGALTASGRLLPREEMAVAADLSGFRVSRVLVEEGQRVRGGEVLATLDEGECGDRAAALTVRAPQHLLDVEGNLESVPVPDACAVSVVLERCERQRRTS